MSSLGKSGQVGGWGNVSNADEFTFLWVKGDNPSHACFLAGAVL